MKNRLIVDIYWCALSATWCCKTFTSIHAQNIVIQKNFVRVEGDAAASPLDPPLLSPIRFPSCCVTCRASLLCLCKSHCQRFSLMLL